MKAPLHDNCRFLLCGWVVGLCSTCSIGIMISVLNLFEHDGYLATAFGKPPIRHDLYSAITSSSVFCSSFELSIAFERIVSSDSPQKYHREPLAIWKLLGLSAIIALLSMTEYFLHNTKFFIACSILMMVMDLSTISVNSVAVRYCRMRYLNLHGWLTLNARYQIKEAFEMSRAMQPVLLTVLVSKSVILISTNIVFYVASFGKYAVGYNEAMYLFVTLVYVNSVTVMLMRTHPSLRRQAVKILFKSKQEPTIPITHEAETESHFEYLRGEWRC